jgi:hypothetical protein
MQLLLGSSVREGGHRVGRLAGFELEPADLRIRRMIVSADGELGPHVRSYPLAAIASVHDDGEIDLDRTLDVSPMPVVRDVVVLSRATRLRRGDHLVGRLSGIEVERSDRSILSVSGRQHWWSRRFTFAASELDCSTPGEIRSGPPSGTRAA